MKKLFASLSISLLFVAMSAASASAYTMATGRSVDVRAPLTDDFYAIGGEVNIDQPVTGDVVVAGGVVNIEADVSGDVLVLGGKVNIYANVGDDVRVIGGTVSVAGNVKDDVVVASGTLEIAKNSTVGGSVLVHGGIVTIDGNVSENINGSANFFKLKGWVNGSVDMQASDVINISDSARIKGDLKYFSRNPALIPDGVVGGKTERVGDGAGVYRTVILGFFSVGYLILKGLQYLSLLLIGLLLFLFIPHELTKMSDMMRKNFWRNTGVGFLILTSGIAFALVSAMTVIGIPVAVMVGALLGFVWYITPLVVGLFVGNYILKHKPRSNVKTYGVMALGMFVYVLVSLIPLLGTAVGFVLMLGGFGTLLRRVYEIGLIVRGKK